MSKKILIVDDDLDTLKLVGLMLQRQGYEIVAASGGAQVLEKAASERPDLILMDVMMPDIDGYEVTRRLRANSDLACIPIIMFSAKALVNDKVAGFEAGADDYLTKPTHPAELTAHVKAVLARAASARAAPVERACVLGFMGARGGIGTTTLAINTGVALTLQGEDVILADLNPGRGSMSLQLGYDRPGGLTALLKRRPEEITPHLVEDQLVTHASGLRVLLASYHPTDFALAEAVGPMQATVRTLTSMSRFLLLDLGCGLSAAIRRAVELCDQVILPIEPNRISVIQTQALVAGLESLGVEQDRIKVVLMKRTRSSLQLTTAKLQELLSLKTVAVVTPAPELAYQANEAGSPMVLVEPQSLTSEQFSRLAHRLVQNGQPTA